MRKKKQTPAQQREHHIHCAKTFIIQARLFMRGNRKPFAYTLLKWAASSRLQAAAVIKNQG